MEGDDSRLATLPGSGSSALKRRSLFSAAAVRSLDASITGVQATPAGGYTKDNLPSTQSVGPPTAAVAWALNKVVGKPDADMSVCEIGQECLREACYGGCPAKPPNGKCKRYHGEKQSPAKRAEIFNAAATYLESPAN